MRKIQTDPSNPINLEINIKKASLEDYRLDVYLTKRLEEYSRSLIQRFIREGLVKVNGKQSKPSYKLHQGDRIAISIPRLIKPQMVPEKIPLDIIYEDTDIIVINKPPGMVVHPAGGHWSGTLVNALLGHCGILPAAGSADVARGDPPDVHRETRLRQDESVFRPGIVHRLDKNTSGIMLAAKTARAHLSLGNQFAKRTVKKEYLTIVEGETSLDSDVIDKPMSRHRRDREKMAISKKGKGKEAISYYEVQERFKGFTLLKVVPKTGRTHQIRVHLAALGHPVVADNKYGVRNKISIADLYPDTEYRDEILLDRQALHAYKIAFTHPGLSAGQADTGKEVSFTTELPDDMNKLLKALRKYRDLV